MPEIIEERRAYLLDISLFIFDILNPVKIIKSSSNNRVILEVPSAFVTMLWSSASGDTLLQELIYAYLIGMQKNGAFAKNKIEKIRYWANASNQEIKDFSQIVYKHIQDYYSQLIDGAKKRTIETNTYHPIHRYEPILAEQSYEDLSQDERCILNRVWYSYPPFV